MVASWQCRGQALRLAKQLQVWLQLAAQAMHWLDEQGAFLNNYDLGDSLGSIEALMKKHQAFLGAFEAQGSKVSSCRNLHPTDVPQRYIR